MIFFTRVQNQISQSESILIISRNLSQKSNPTVVHCDKFSKYCQISDGSNSIATFRIVKSNHSRLGYVLINNLLNIQFLVSEIISITRSTVVAFVLFIFLIITFVWFDSGRAEQVSQCSEAFWRHNLRVFHNFFSRTSWFENDPALRRKH